MKCNRMAGFLIFAALAGCGNAIPGKMVIGYSENGSEWDIRAIRKTDGKAAVRYAVNYSGEAIASQGMGGFTLLDPVVSVNYAGSFDCARHRYKMLSEFLLYRSGRIASAQNRSAGAVLPKTPMASTMNYACKPWYVRWVEYAESALRPEPAYFPVPAQPGFAAAQLPNRQAGAGYPEIKPADSRYDQQAVDGMLAKYSDYINQGLYPGDAMRHAVRDALDRPR